MKILLISHALVVDTYRQKIKYLMADQQIEVKVLTPQKWQEAGQIVRSKNTNGFHHSSFAFRLYKYHGATFLYGFKLFNLIRTFKPDIIHLDEEPYSLAALQVIIFRWLLNRQSKLIFFTWQNIHKKYFPPFSFIYKLSLRCADGAIAGNEEAAKILREKGFRKPLKVIPQFGVDGLELGESLNIKRRPENKKIIGYIGRLIYEKGIDILIQAVASLNVGYELWIIGNGPFVTDILRLADEHNIRNRVRFYHGIPHREIPRYLRLIDVLVLPSRTGESWKEQFGRVLVEAMACGVPVIGSSSGAIPEVIGNAGVVFPESNADSLYKELHRILTDEKFRVLLSKQGRARFFANYSHDILASKTRDFYNLLSHNE